MARETSKHKQPKKERQFGDDEDLEKEEFRPDAASFNPGKVHHGSKKNTGSNKERSAPNLRSDEYDYELPNGDAVLHGMRAGKNARNHTLGALAKD